MNRKSLRGIYFILALDLLTALGIITILVVQADISPDLFKAVLAASGVYLFLRSVTGFISHKRFLSMLDSIVKIVNNFKRGRFSVNESMPSGKGELGKIYYDLVTMSKHLDDIMSSQKAEIKNYKELYNNIIFSMKSYFLVINDKEDIIFANESFCKKFQLELDDITGKNLDDIFLFFIGNVREAISQIKKTGEPVIVERTHILAKNRIAVIGDVKLSNIVIRGENQITLVIDDITSKCRKDYQISLISQISESIQRDEEIEKILYIILTGITSGSGLGFNRAMLFLYDKNSNKLSGKMAVGPDNIDEAVEIWTSISNNSVAKYQENAASAPKGKEFIEKVLMTGFDIESNNVFTISFKNVQNMHIHDSFNDDRVDDSIREFMNVKEFAVVPLIIMDKAIGIIVADNKFNNMPIGAESIELLSVFASQAALSIEGYENITKLKKEMDKLKSRQTAIVESEKLAAVGRIALHIAHEIRNPLVTMGGYAKRIIDLSKGLSKNSDKIMKSASVIFKESERLEKTLSNVMDFTRESPIIMEFNDINEIMHDTLDLLKNVFQERRVNVNLILDYNMPLVKSDYNKMKQVVLNLLQNSLDETPNGGTVEIETAQQDKHVIIYIRNTGSKILEEDVNIIFEPFFTTKVTGVGLGLAIVKKIINDHNGEITVENTNEGVQFNIILPLPG